MPSAPKIQKEVILETAFQILIRDGYSEVNIKNVAKELNCSTQPISWQFGGMENFRKELLQYCISYVNDKFSAGEESVEKIIDRIVTTYIDLVYDTPNLYRYLYMDGTEANKLGELAKAMRQGSKGRITDLLAERYGISREAANRYLMNVEFYVHGIATYVVTGFVVMPKKNIEDMISAACKAFIVAEQTS